MSGTQEFVVRGPVPDVALLDATWQDRPTWTPDAGGVTVHAPGLVYDGPPYPGLLVRANVPPNDGLRIFFGEALPAGIQLELVGQPELVVGDHGFDIETSAGNASVHLASGTYDVGVWVQPVALHRARTVAFVFGPRRPRRLGPPTRR